MTVGTPQHTVPIDLPLDGARSLFLVVDDGGDGYSCDWADWIEPRLIGPQGEKPLTDLKWKSARADWGSVRVGRNANGGPLRVAGQPLEDGIGAHAHSVIEYELPEGYTRFTARGGLDNGGTDQGGQTSVRFFVYTQKPPARYLANSTSASDRTPETAVENLDVHPRLEATLFAAEPMLLSPSNIDIDHRGRVWVCEVINYRGHNGERPEGDRILILEDTDGDGQADTEKVFYQGRDIDSPHGVCVLGKHVIVSAGSQVLCFTDEDGDDRPDKKEVWFSGISGVQHDHGIHAFVFGPDGKLYFNFGNEGKQLKDAQGQPITDLAGNVVAEHRQPYQQGMVFRCNPDLTQLETLGWNFRNNWMVTVDSFGSIWQSDNDDDGNRGVRINYVMEFGNYGYRDEITGAGWNTERIGMAAEIPLRHWHLNDPGVVPNLLQTGGGSPTGITVYEGDALLESLHGQLIHCDAGPSVTRAYVVHDQGAGYGAEIVNLLEGKRDPWFRPSDVKVAPDGSLIVADWYDPGVGGHRMEDLIRGRLFRITRPGGGDKYEQPTFDFSSAEGAVEALRNPNYAVRYLAWQALHEMGPNAEAALQSLRESEQPFLRARALWLLGKIPGRGMHYVEVAAADADPRIRMLALRLARQLDDVDQVEIASRLAHDPSPGVRRECAIALRHSPDPRAATIWATLAAQHDGHDRWYLEALGIAADRQWDSFLATWLTQTPDAIQTPAGRDIIWRSRAAQTPKLLQRILANPGVAVDELPRYLRALDFLQGETRDEAVTELAFDFPWPDDERGALVRNAVLARLNPDQLRSNPKRQRQIGAALDAMRGTRQFIDLVQRFRLQDRYDEIVALAIAKPDQAEGIEAVRMLLAQGQRPRLKEALEQRPAEDQLRIVEVLGRSSDNRAVDLLRDVMLDADRAAELRRAAVHGLAQVRAGAEYLVARAENEGVPVDLTQAVAADLHQVPWDDLRNRANLLFPLAPAKDNQPLPSIRDLARGQGETEAGRKVFLESGTCAKCHVVRGEGKAVGPELSEIGDKLSREALFESILYPSAGISHSFETYTVELTDGNVVSGILVSQTDEAIEIKNNEGVVRRFAPSDVEHLTRQPVSLMPADLHQALTEQDLVNLVEYLRTLKK